MLVKWLDKCGVSACLHGCRARTGRRGAPQHTCAPTRMWKVPCALLLTTAALGRALTSVAIPSHRSQSHARSQNAFGPTKGWEGCLHPVLGSTAPALAAAGGRRKHACSQCNSTTRRAAQHTPWPKVDEIVLVNVQHMSWLLRGKIQNKKEKNIQVGRRGQRGVPQSALKPRLPVRAPVRAAVRAAHSEGVQRSIGHLWTSCMQVPYSPGTVDHVQPFLHRVHLP